MDNARNTTTQTDAVVLHSMRRHGTIFRLVRHHRVQDYLNVGWHIAQHDLLHHGDWSVLLTWLCDCPVVEPKETP